MHACVRAHKVCDGKRFVGVICECDPDVYFENRQNEENRLIAGSKIYVNGSSGNAY